MICCLVVVAKVSDCWICQRFRMDYIDCHKWGQWPNIFIRQCLDYSLVPMATIVMSYELITSTGCICRYPLQCKDPHTPTGKLVSAKVHV